MSRDPYHDFVDEIRKSIDAASKLESAMRTGDRDARRELNGTLATLRQDIGDVRETVRIVESNPSRFGIDATELDRRRKFVRKSERELQVCGAVRGALTTAARV